MSLPDLYGTFYPDLSRAYQLHWLEAQSFPVYQGETLNGDLIVFNGGTKKAEAFEVDLYISTDETIDTSDRYIGTYTFADGIEGESSFSTFSDLPKNPATFTLPNSEDAFWQDQEIYYLGAIIDPNNVVRESNENNNSPKIPHYQSVNGMSASTPVTIEQADLPVVSFTQHDNTLNINLSEPAPENGFTISYQNISKKDYLKGINIPDQYNYRYWHRDFRGNFYDPESNRLYIKQTNYYDLADYKYYDANGGHYDPAEDKYFNDDGSYYDISEKLFYDADGNAQELIDNSAEYTDSSSTPRHYLPTGGYISLISGIYYDARGGYIDETNQEYFIREGQNGLGYRPVKIAALTGYVAIENGFDILPIIATPNLDYKIIPEENIAGLTDSTITIEPGETTAEIDFEFISDSIFDPNETIEFELLENEAEYLIGRASLYRYFIPRPNLEDLQNPRLGDFKFSVDQNAKPGTEVGQINFNDPQGDELIYSLVDGGNELYDLIDGEYYLKPEYHYTDLDLDLDLIETSNQDLDGDGIHPFSIDSSTGTITLTDFDDLDREAINNIPPSDRSQLYNSGYYQLFVRITDEIPTEEELRYSLLAPYETSIVNVQVANIPTTGKNDDVSGSANHDVIQGLAGDDTINGLAGNDTITGNRDNDKLLGGKDNDFLKGSGGKDVLLGGLGNDTLKGGTDSDKLLGGLGDDTLIGSSGSDTLNGGANNDLLRGGDEDDVLNGSQGNDTLDGGAGADRLIGDAGADIFALEIDSGQDVIVDFENGVDLINIPNTLSFGELNIVHLSIYSYSATMIQDSNTNKILAVIEEVSPDLITEADFIV